MRQKPGGRSPLPVLVKHRHDRFPLVFFHVPSGFFDLILPVQNGIQTGLLQSIYSEDDATNALGH